MDETLIHITVTDINRDEGSVVLFDGFLTDDTGTYEVVFAVEHLPAQDIAAALADDCDVNVAIEPWSLLRKVRAA